MNILVAGAGVIGTTYAWKLSQAGHQVTLLVRPGQKRAAERDGFTIYCKDERKKQTPPEEVVYHPPVVETLAAASPVDLILVTVKSNQLDALLPDLAKYAGRADVLFFQNNGWGSQHIQKFLPESQILFGFSRLIRGWKEGRCIECIIFDSPLMSTLLGEASGEITPRLQKYEAMFRQADLKPQLHRHITDWLATHYVEFLGAAGGILQAGCTEYFVEDDALLREALLATREGLDICRARGINLFRSALFNLWLYYLPLALIIPLARWQYKLPSIQQFFDENVSHNMDELRHGYFDVLNEGIRLGVPTPHLEVFGQRFAQSRTRPVYEYA